MRRAIQSFVGELNGSLINNVYDILCNIESIIGVVNVREVLSLSKNVIKM